MTTTYAGSALNITTTNATPNSVATSTTGSWDSVTTGTQGAWIDVKGGTWSNISGPSFSSQGTGSSDYLTAFMARPSGEAFQDGSITVSFPIGGFFGSSSGINLRLDTSTGSQYLLTTAGGSLEIFAINSGGVSVIASETITGFTIAHAYTLTLTAVGASPTTLSATMVDDTSSTTVSTIAPFTDSSIELQTAGVQALLAWSGTTFFASSVIIANTNSAPSLAVSPSTSTNAQIVTYTLTGTDTSWTSGTTFSISGVTGATIVMQSVNVGAQTGSVQVALGSANVGTLTFTDSTDAASGTSTVTLAAPGIPQVVTITPGNMQNILAWHAPNSGGAVATYNVYRGTTPGGESGTPIMTGIAALTYTDTGLTNGQIYYYKIAAVNATATGTLSAEVSATPAAGGVSNLTSPQALAAIGVLGRTIQPPFLTQSQTGMFIFNNKLVIPLTAYNLALGAAVINGADSNNIYLSFEPGDPASGYGALGTEVGSSGVTGGGAGGLTSAQILAVLGAIMHTLQPPFLTQNQTGVYLLANQLVIPQSSYNLGLGSGLVISTDSVNVFIGLNPGDPANGY